MTPLRIRPGVRALALTTTAFIALASFADDAQAKTAAGTVIRNQATATYTDGSGNSYQAQSNVAEITVKKVYEATIANDRRKQGSAGQTVYSSHTLSNQGNSEAYYRINVHDLKSTVSQLDSGVQNGLLNLVDTKVYHDLNGNGVADAGEPVVAGWTGGGAATSSVIRVEAGQDIQLIIAAQVPTTAISANKLGAAIYVQPVSASGAPSAPPTVVADPGEFGVVRNITPISGRNDLSLNDAAALHAALGRDGGINALQIDVTANAVLEVTKEATLDVATQRIHYVTTIRNVGGRPANNVLIYDAAPAGTRLVDPIVLDSGGNPYYSTSSIVSRGFGGLADDTAAVGVLFDEVALAQDLNGDGVLSTSVAGARGVDGVIAPGVTVQLAFSVAYDPAIFPIGSKVTNIAYVHADLDGVTGRDGSPQPSNPAITQIGAALYGVTIRDTKIGADPDSNDGGDDGGVDSTTTPADNVQLVSTVPPGATVIFRNVITNTGTTADRFNLSLPAGIDTFPPGTQIAFWNEGGSVLLLDTDGDGVPNTPTIPANGSYTIEVRATLPQNVSGVGPYDFTVRATSSLDSTESDTVINRLGEISAARVDIVNTVPAGAWPATNVEPYEPDTDLPVTPITVNTIAPGQSTSFNLTLKNKGGSPDSFQLYAGGRWYDGYADALQKLQPLESGWSVRFYGPGNVELSTTPAIPANGTYSLTAVVTAPADAWQTQINYLEDVRSKAAGGGPDGTDDAIGNGTYSNAYPFFFLAHSRISGAWDVKLDAAKVLPAPKFSLSASKEEQTIIPGGYSRTSHSVKNTGNIDGVFALSVNNPTSSWGATIWLDTDGDGVPDTNIAAMSTTGPANNTIIGRDQNGDPVTITYTANGFVVPPGVEIPVWMDVYAPANAAPNDVNVPVLGARDTNVSGSDQSARIPYRVTLGVLRLVKTVAADSSCLHTPDGPFTEQSSRVAPDDCAIWQVVGSNVGSQPIYTVQLNDAVPDFTRYVPDSVLFCNEDAGLTDTAACTLIPVDDADLNPRPAASGLGNIGITLTPAMVGVTPAQIAPGASFTVRFMTVVD